MFIVDAFILSFLPLQPAGGPAASLPPATPDWVLTDSDAFPMDPSQISVRVVHAYAAGDVNGDGYDDVLATSADSVTSGTARVYAGGPDGLGSEPIWHVEGEDPSFGITGSGVGDVDDDGFDDFVVCAPYAGVVTTYEGYCALYLGDAAGPSTTPVWETMGSALLGVPQFQAPGGLGAAIAGPVDLDGDGIDDFVITSPGASTAGMVSGAMVVVFGGADMSTPTTQIVTAPPEGVQYVSDIEFGTAIAGVPDLDGDGDDEIATHFGGIFDPFGKDKDPLLMIFAGDADEIDDDPTWTLTPSLSTQGLLTYVAAVTVGDFDADGEPEIVYALQGQAVAGTVNGIDIFASVDGELESVWWTNGRDLASKPSLTGFASWLDAADLDGDGRDDLLISGGAGGGQSFLLLPGTAEGPSSPLVILESGPGPLGSYETPVYAAVGVGDVDDDGREDMGNSARLESNGTSDLHLEIQVHHGAAFTPCDADADLDSICNSADNCIAVFNPTQIDTDGDGDGDECDFDDETTGSDEGGEEGNTSGTGDSGGTADLEGTTTEAVGSSGAPLDPSSTGDAPADTSATETAGIGNEIAEAGCGCRSGGPSSSWLWLAVFALLRRRTRAAAWAGLATLGCSGSARDIGELTYGTGPSSSDDDGSTTAAADSTSGSTGDQAPNTDTGSTGELCCGLGGTAVVDCASDEPVLDCAAHEVCIPGLLDCVDVCTEAEANADAIGCEYFSAPMPALDWGASMCHAVVLANSSDLAVHVEVEYDGRPVDLTDHMVLVTGTNGEGIPTVEWLDPRQGLPPHSAVALLLTGEGCATYLPGSTSAVPEAFFAVADAANDSWDPKVTVHVPHSGIGHAFRIRTNAPVAVTQVAPFLGPESFTPAASVLIPTAHWGDNYIVMAPGDLLPWATPGGAEGYRPSVVIVALEDDTTVTMLPTANIVGGSGISSSIAEEPLEIALDAGEYAQIVQQASLTGSVIATDRPVQVLDGHECQYFPATAEACDHMEQTMPPVDTIGSRYVGVSVSRLGEVGEWRLLGAVDGTELTWSTDVGGPTTLDRAEVVHFQAASPFVVSSQDAEHPFWMFNYMTGQMQLVDDGLISVTEASGPYGDPDHVINVSPEQYGERSTFFVDPTYEHTQLVVVRQWGGQDELKGFFDVELECADAGAIEGWQEIDAEFQYARVDFGVDPYSQCEGGTMEMRSGAPFGAWVWSYDYCASVGYPATLGLAKINDVVIPPIP